LNNTGVCYLNFKNDAARAKQYFEKTLEVNPDFMQAYINLLVCAQNSNDETTQLKYLRILLKKGVSVNDIRARGVKLSDELLQKINAQQ
jgi:Tfp pilus assembly protein PilF